jgi:hypothetical protein
LCTTRVTLRRDEDALSRATGFFYQIPTGVAGYENIVFLVTAYHALTMHTPTENVPNQGNLVDFWLHTSLDELGALKKCTLLLYTKKGQPTWLHSQAFAQADIALLPVPTRFLEGGRESTSLGHDWVEEPLKLSVAMNVAIVGYPYGLCDEAHGLPVWKTGTIASEPYVDFQGQPSFLVDVAAFAGMSGAPVVAMARGLWESEEKLGTLNVGAAQRLVGVYASMAPHTTKKFLEDVSQSGVPGMQFEESLQLGQVWKASLIQEIASSLDPVRYIADILSQT